MCTHTNRYRCDVMDRGVKEHILSLTTRREVAKVTKAVNVQLGRQRAGLAAEKAAMQRDLETADATVKTLVEAIDEGTPIDAIREQLKARDQERNRLRTKLAEIHPSTHRSATNHTASTGQGRNRP